MELKIIIYLLKNCEIKVPFYFALLVTLLKMGT